MGAASAVDPMAAAAMAASRPPDETAVVNLREGINLADTFFDIRWDAPTYSAMPLRDYQVRVDWGSWTSIPAIADSHTVGRRVPGRRYRVEVRARFGDADDGFNGKKSTIYITTTGSAAGVPDAPQNLKSKLLGNDNVRLTWKVADTGGEARWWEIEIRSGTWVSTGGDRPRLTYGPHRAGVTRTYKVRGVNSHGTGPETSIEVTREPLSSTPPTRVQNFTWTAGSRNNEYVLSW
ncbi:MAG: fibronectin type III domain-containing protein, partial [Acidobacteria bacterium]|nr:fibronectin type III domain-containing protein [Acidobacteriota bacterium]